jgi:N6-adenosine-specific RNA methylase IME4
MRKQSIALQEIRPIVIGCFTLTETGVVIKGRPSFGEYNGVLEFSRQAHKAAGWWVSDLLRYGETRPDWREKLEQVVDATGYSEKTARNLKYIGENVALSRRRGDVDISLHAEVAPLHPKEQIEWLEKAATERWSTRDLRLAIRASKRRLVIEGQAVLEGMYRVLYADPPWIYDDRQPSGSSSAAHFPGMTIEELCKLPVPAHTMPNALLAMWVTAPMMLSNPGPREVGEAWGFTYKQQIVWDKVLPAGGNYTQGNHEILTLWTRGSCVPDVQRDLPDSVQTFRKTPVHSEKPPEFRKLLEKHWTSGPYLELFGREPVEGWSVFGNDARLWAEEAKSA